MAMVAGWRGRARHKEFVRDVDERTCRIAALVAARQAEVDELAGRAVRERVRNGFAERIAAAFAVSRGDVVERVRK